MSTKFVIVSYQLGQVPVSLGDFTLHTVTVLQWDHTGLTRLISSASGRLRENLGHLMRLVVCMSLWC